MVVDIVLLTSALTELACQTRPDEPVASLRAVPSQRAPLDAGDVRWATTTNCLIPVLTPEGRILGTGTLVRIERHAFIFTAGHVVEEVMVRQGGSAKLPPNRETFGRRNTWKVSNMVDWSGDAVLLDNRAPSRGHPIDLGALILNEDVFTRLFKGGFRSLPLDALSEEIDSSPDADYFITGWPGEESSFDDDAGTLRADRITKMGSRFEPTREYDWYNPKYHIAVQYSIGHKDYRITEQPDGAFVLDSDRYTVKSPAGMSGASAWSVPGDGGIGSFVAIQSFGPKWARPEDAGDAIVSVMLEPLMQKLGERFSDLRPKIRERFPSTHW